MMRLSEVASVVDGKLSGGDCFFTGVSIDSRKIQSGDLFVAIPGEKFDGHNYVVKAEESGAIASMVSSRTLNNKVQIDVQDTTLALGKLAAYWRSHFDIPVIAITGSNGKTTVSRMVATILKESGECLYPRGSFNNQWGVPLTMLRLKKWHRYAVIEMGMNHPGEIGYLSSITAPTVALITNVSSAHLEGLGSVEKIAAAKAEIFNGLKLSGIAIINTDDQFFPYWYERLQRVSTLTFGSSTASMISLKNFCMYPFGSSFEIMLEDQVLPVELSVPGKHNAMNAVAASAASYSVGASLSQIQTGLKKFQPIPGRLCKKPGLNRSTIMDDTYNANSASIEAAIDVLSASGKKSFLVLGTMGELGSESNVLHYRVAWYAREKGIQHFYCLSTADNNFVKCYQQGYGKYTKVFESVEQLIDKLRAELNHDTIVLVKGSRSSGMERVVNKLIFKNSRDEDQLC